MARNQEQTNDSVTLGEISRRLDTHIEDEGRRSERVLNDIATIKDNHLTHLGEDVGTLKTNMGMVSSDVAWLKKYHWTVAAAGIAGAVAGIANLLIK